MKPVRVFFTALAFFLFAYAATPATSHATVTMSRDVFLVTPAAPGPNESVKVQFTGKSDLPPDSTLHWYIDDVEQTGRWRVNQVLTTTNNEPYIEFVTKEAGEITEVKAVLSTPAGDREYYLFIDPSRLDLIINANGHTPSFYRGRSLPSRGSVITAQALVFTDEPGPLRYDWSVNNKTIKQSVGGNNSSINYEIGLIYEALVTVQVFNGRGELIATESTKFIPNDPEILFYEANPLRGLIPNVLRDPYQFLNHEMVLRGEPYYFAGTADDMKVTWKADRTKLKSNQNPFEVSLVKTKESGQAVLSMKVIDTKSHLTSAEADLTIRY